MYVLPQTELSLYWILNLLCQFPFTASKRLKYIRKFHCKQKYMALGIENITRHVVSYRKIKCKEHEEDSEKMVHITIFIDGAEFELI